MLTLEDEDSEDELDHEIKIPWPRKGFNTRPPNHLYGAAHGLRLSGSPQVLAEVLAFD